MLPFGRQNALRGALRSNVFVTTHNGFFLRRMFFGGVGGRIADEFGRASEQGCGEETSQGEVGVRRRHMYPVTFSGDIWRRRRGIGGPYIDALLI